MPILQDASTQDLKRLLEVFPASSIKAGWPSIRGTKEEICFAAAESRDLPRILEFIYRNFNRCKQHVYIFTKPEETPDISELIPECEIVDVRNGSEVIAILRSEYSILLRDPPEETTMDFLWPMRIDDLGELLIVRFVVMERNPCAYFDRDCYVTSRVVEEREIVLKLEASGLKRVDLHKGIKALWQDDFMDAPRTSYKKPKSSAREIMDEERGIKEHNPELYLELQEAILFTTMFTVRPSETCSVTVFHVDPSMGYVAFPRYTEGAGDNDVVVRAILESNN